MIITTYRGRERETIKCLKGGKTKKNNKKVNTLKKLKVFYASLGICYCFLFSAAQVKVLTTETEKKRETAKGNWQNKKQIAREREREKRAKQNKINNIN